jgi:hypothetical protein
MVIKRRRQLHSRNRKSVAIFMSNHRIRNCCPTVFADINRLGLIQESYTGYYRYQFLSFLFDRRSIIAIGRLIDAWRSSIV